MTLANSFTNDPRVYNEAKSLIKTGHKVTVLAWDKKRVNSPKEVKDGINIIRSYNSKLMNLLPYDIFRLHLWWNKGFKDALKLYKENPFEIVHCHDLSSLPIGIKLKKKLGLPLVYDAHEIWGYMVAKDLPNWWAKYYLWKEKKLIRYVDKIITVNQPLKKYFNEITNKQINIVMNCKHLQSTKYESSSNKKFTLLYIGVFSKPRFLLELVDVVKELPDINCIIAGSGSNIEYVNSLKNKCSNVKNIDFMGRVPMEKVLPMTKKADVVVCKANPNDLNNRIGLANKQFEAMVTGRPIIVTKDMYYSTNFVEKEKCGLSVENNSASIRKAVIKLRDNPKLCEELGRNGLDAALKKYNWGIEEKKLIGLYKRIERSS